jgi:hypothetical protein
MIAPHDVLVTRDQFPYEMLSDQIVRLLEIAKLVRDCQIPNLVMSNYLPW